MLENGLTTAAKQIKAWEEQFGISLRIVVNISPIHLKEASFIPKLKQIISDTGINPFHLELQVTDITILDDVEAFINQLNKIRMLGITIVLNHFGTSMSSLSRLCELPIDALKVDSLFVQKLSTDAKYERMLAAIIQMGKALNLDIIAGDIEKEEQVVKLKQYGCDIIQGDYYNEPMPLEAFVYNMLVNKRC
ncbi:MAG: EAL domain-containing protein [Bacillus sp. (in: firmicutes)]